MLVRLEVFRGHVLRRAVERIAVPAGRVGQKGQAEIGYFCLPLFTQHDIGGFDIAMHDILGMSRGRALQDIAHDADFLIQAAALTNLALQGFAVDKFEHQVGSAILHANVENADDVGMLQLADGARLGQQLIDVAVELKSGFQIDRLDGDLAIQIRIVCEVNNTLAALAEHLVDVESIYFVRKAGCHVKLQDYVVTKV